MNRVLYKETAPTQVIVDGSNTTRMSVMLSVSADGANPSESEVYVLGSNDGNTFIPISKMKTTGTGNQTDYGVVETLFSHIKFSLTKCPAPSADGGRIDLYVDAIGSD